MKKSERNSKTIIARSLFSHDSQGQENHSVQKDFKRIRHDAVLKSEVLDVASRLAADVLLPDKYRDHALHNNWEGARDCHIRPDVVLIYRKYEDVLSILKLERLGSHSELGL